MVKAVKKSAVKKPVAKKKAVKKPVPVLHNDDAGSWAIKYRPKDLDDLVVPSSAVRILKALAKERPKSASILISGPTGCGKTTTAEWIMAEFAKEGGDAIVFSCSESRGIDAVRELLAQSRYFPSSKASRRVIVLDEVHALSGAAKDSILKALEDTKLPVYWVLVTNQPEALDRTVKTRGIHIALPPIPRDGIIGRLKIVMKKEKALAKWPKKDQEDALSAIATECAGSLREALHSLQAVHQGTEAHKAPTLALARKEGLLPGLASQIDPMVDVLMRAVDNKDIPAAIKALNRVRFEDAATTMNNIILAISSAAFAGELNDHIAVWGERLELALQAADALASRPGPHAQNRARLLALLCAMARVGGNGEA